MAKAKEYFSTSFLHCDNIAVARAMAVILTIIKKH